MEENQSFLELLKNTPISVIMKSGQPLITLSPNDTVSNALKILATNEITSAPIFDQSKQTFIGFVDVLDLAVFIARLFGDNYAKHRHLYVPQELKDQFSKSVEAVMNMSQRDPFIPVDASWSLEILISNFLKWGVHRVPVISNNKVSGIISQSDVVNFINEKANSFPKLFSTSIHNLGLTEGNVIAVSNADTLMTAFNTILTSGVSGIAIVDLNGVLVNNLSASDLKGLTESTFYKLEAPIHQILETTPRKLAPVTCKPFQSLASVLQLFNDTGIHRIYVTNDEEKPTNVITLTTILKIVTSIPQS